MTPTPFYATETATLYTGDALELLATLTGSSVDCLISSPPFWGLRDYGTGHWFGGDPACAHSTGRGTNTHQAGTGGGDVGYPASPAHRGGNPRHCRRCGAVREDQQYGLEPTPQSYVDTLRAVFAEVRRVLTPTGTVWLNLGDSYSAEPPGASRHAMRNSTLHGKQAAGILRDSVRRASLDRTRTLPRKNLLGMPWRVALALQADGWGLRNAAIWAKTNPMPESVKDRLSTTYEFIFLLTKQPHYFFDLDAIRVPRAQPETVTGPVAARRRTHSTGDTKYAATGPFVRGRPGVAMRTPGRTHSASHPRGKNPGDVWHLSTRPLREAHFAAFPVDIPLRCIAAGCPPGGLVLDPFSGAATTGVAALRLGRRYLGFELSDAHNEIGKRRLQQETRNGDTNRTPQAA